MPITKFRTYSTYIAIIFMFATVSWAKPVAGPNGGKIIGDEPDRAELVIREDGMVTIVFLDDTGGVGDRQVKLYAQLESGRKEFELVREGNVFASTESLPQPDGYTLIVQVKANAEARPVNVRVQYLMYECSGCSMKEYACTCADH